MTFEKGNEAEERPLEERFGFTFTTGFFVAPAKLAALSELLPRVGVGGQNNSNPPTSHVMRIDMWGAGWHLTILLRL